MEFECCPGVQAGPLTNDDAVELAAIFKALADPVRLQLLSIIAANDEASACDLPPEVDRSQATVSHHLTQLTAVGLLTREQRGKWAWFTADKERMAQVAAALASPATQER